MNILKKILEVFTGFLLLVIIALCAAVIIMGLLLVLAYVSVSIGAILG